MSCYTYFGALKLYRWPLIHNIAYLKKNPHILGEEIHSVLSYDNMTFLFALSCYLQQQS